MRRIVVTLVIPAANPTLSGIRAVYPMMVVGIIEAASGASEIASNPLPLQDRMSPPIMKHPTATILRAMDLRTLPSPPVGTSLPEFEERHAGLRLLRDRGNWDRVQSPAKGEIQTGLGVSFIPEKTGKPEHV